MIRVEDLSVFMLFHLLYCSTANYLFGTPELDELLLQSRNRNAAEGVTGLLLYHQGGFVQVLEGSEHGVRRIFESIRRDRRHHDVTVVLEEPISAREFGDWHMAFQRIDSEAERPAGFSDFLTRPWDPPQCSDNPGGVHALLLSFRENARG